MTKAVYAGSFDPITNGHLDLIARANKVFDTVYVAIAVNTSKKSFFTTEEKIALTEEALKDFDHVKVISFESGLTVDLAKSLGATVLIRGLRNTADLEYEANIAYMNKLQDDSVDTMFFLSDEKYRFVSSSMIKEVAINGGDVSKVVPENIAKAMKAKSRV